MLTILAQLIIVALGGLACAFILEWHKETRA
jgi:hypothetical protein